MCQGATRRRHRSRSRRAARSRARSSRWGRASPGSRSGIASCRWPAVVWPRRRSPPRVRRSAARRRPVRKAAALPVNYGTTWFALHDRGQLAAGETVLVTGAAGGTGTAAIQIGAGRGRARHRRRRRTGEGRAVPELGADVVIDHRETPEWVDLVTRGDRRRASTSPTTRSAATLPPGAPVHGVGRPAARHRLRRGHPRRADQPHPAQELLVVGVHWGASLAAAPVSLARRSTRAATLAGQGAVDPPLDPLRLRRRRPQPCRTSPTARSVGKVIGASDQRRCSLATEDVRQAPRMTRRRARGSRSGGSRDADSWYAPPATCVDRRRLVRRTDRSTTGGLPVTRRRGRRIVWR